jgi:hypothetical protein
MKTDLAMTEAQKHTPTPWRVCPHTDSVYADAEKGHMKICDIRGWGYLTGKGGGALGLSEDEAIAIQKANAAHIVKCVNAHEAHANLAEVVADFILDCDNGLGPSVERLRLALAKVDGVWA